MPTASRVVTHPCPLSWDALVGDARVRACAACERDVHALDALTLAEAEALRARGACFRVTELPGGRVLTREGWRRWRSAAVLAGTLATAACAPDAPPTAAPAPQAAGSPDAAHPDAPTASAPSAPKPDADATQPCDAECREALQWMGYID